MPDYLDEQGNPLKGTGQYLDENGNPPHPETSSLWQRVNTGLISPETILQGLTGDETAQTITQRHIGEALPGENPSDAFWRTLREGVAKSGAETLSSFTSPLSIALMGAGKAVEALPAASKLVGPAKAALAGIGLGFGAQGGVQALTPRQPNETKPEAYQRQLQGASQAAMGAAGIVPSAEAIRTGAKAAFEQFKGSPTAMRQAVFQAAKEHFSNVEQAARAEAHATYPKLEGSTDISPAIDAMKESVKANLTGVKSAPALIQKLFDEYGNATAASNQTGESLDTPIEKLQGIRKELGDAAASQPRRSVEFKVLRDTQAAFDDLIEAHADLTDQGDAYRSAQQTWGKFMRTFHDNRAIPRGGSPISRILSAQDPAYAEDIVLGKSGQRVKQGLRNYQHLGADPQVADALGRMGKAMRSDPTVNLMAGGLGTWWAAHNILAGNWGTAAAALTLYPAVKYGAGLTEAYLGTRPYRFSDVLKNPLNIQQQAATRTFGAPEENIMQRRIAGGEMTPQEALTAAKEGQVPYPALNRMFSRIKSGQPPQQ